MLIFGGHKLELISDIDMLLFLEDGIRGGVSYCATRQAEEDNDEKEHLAYLDANNLVRNINARAISE